MALLKAALGEAAGQRAIGQTQSVTLRLSLLALAHHCCGQLERGEPFISLHLPTSPFLSLYLTLTLSLSLTLNLT